MNKKHINIKDFGSIQLTTLHDECTLISIQFEGGFNKRFVLTKEETDQIKEFLNETNKNSMF